MYSNKSVLTQKLRSMPLGDTPDGVEWALKALHPAEHSANPRGMPTHDATSVVTLQFQRELLISPPEGVTGDTWDLDLWALRDPCLFAAYQKLGSNGSGLTYGSVCNDQLGATYDEATGALTNLCEAFRVSYQSATGHLVAPALADQGTVRAAQYDFPAYIRPVTLGAEGGASALGWIMGRPAAQYPDALIPYSQLVQMPNCYQEVAKEGFYMPLKLSEKDKEFRRTNELELLVGLQADTATVNTVIATSDQGPRWPLYEEGGHLGWHPGDLIGHIAFRGLSTQASVQLIFRCGVDLKVRPGTMYSPFNHEPPVYDATAIKMYFEIARRMADAYPASFNSAGTLLKIVAGIAQQIWPIVEPHAQALLKKLTTKINQKVQKAVADKKPAAAPKGKGGAKKKEAPTEAKAEAK